MLEMLLNMYRKAIREREAADFRAYVCDLTCQEYNAEDLRSAFLKAQGRAEALLEVINTFGNEARERAHVIHHGVMVQYELKYQKAENDFITEVRD